jgi:maltooligosyltrehalose trehalohydrolase
VNLTDDDSCSFMVWAPNAREVQLQIESASQRQIQMNPMQNGYFHCCASPIPAGATYFYVLDGQKRRPDPASKYQPQGVHGPSQVCSGAFDWTDSPWHGISLESAVFYELHVGTFTPEGTLDAIISRLAALKALGITLLELMPVAQFPGKRNWGYDGVFPYAVQNSYGGPCALKRLVNACHALGIGVALDVVYNHLGPEGNYLHDFGPYFTDRYKTPWGDAINFDGGQSNEVRRFFLENALYWIREFHVDALRLDAVHAIIDVSAKRFLEELTERVKQVSMQLGREIHIIAENDRNDARSLKSLELGGFDFDSQWNDDFHHSIHALVTGERQGYYQDFGSIHHLAKACREGFVYSGQYSAFRKCSHGSSSAETPNQKFAVFSQNHDQVGNRAQGERLSQLVDFETQKLIAGIVLLSPFIPLVFMGEEYGESAPFQYFVSHEDQELLEKVREGRRREFGVFDWSDAIPDPAEFETFSRSKLHWDTRDTGQHRVLLSFYTELLRLRRTLPALSNPSKAGTNVTEVDPEALIIRRTHGTDCVTMLFNFGQGRVRLNIPLDKSRWQKQLDSRDGKWGGPGSSTPEFIGAASDITLEIEKRSFALFRIDRGRVL